MGHRSGSGAPSVSNGGGVTISTRCRSEGFWRWRAPALPTSDDLTDLRTILFILEHVQGDAKALRASPVAVGVVRLSKYRHLALANFFSRDGGGSFYATGELPTDRTHGAASSSPSISSVPSLKSSVAPLTRGFASFIDATLEEADVR